MADHSLFVFVRVQNATPEAAVNVHHARPVACFKKIENVPLALAVSDFPRRLGLSVCRTLTRPARDDAGVLRHTRAVVVFSLEIAAHFESG